LLVVILGTEAVNQLRNFGQVCLLFTDNVPLLTRIFGYLMRKLFPVSVIEQSVKRRDKLIMLKDYIIPFDKESLDWCEKASLFPKMWKIILGQFGTLYTTTIYNAQLAKA
jgi:hypothetical protein